MRPSSWAVFVLAEAPSSMGLNWDDVLLRVVSSWHETQEEAVEYGKNHVNYKERFTVMPIYSGGQG